MLLKSCFAGAFLLTSSLLARQVSAEPLPYSPTAWFAYKPRAIELQQLKTEYETWKQRHLVVCEDGSADVRKDEGEGVSEGTGYGMLLTVTAGDRQTFDRLLKAFIKRKNVRGMMSWHFGLCGGTWGVGAATDGDLDIAMALVMADRRWGSYRQEAESLISAIKQYASAQCSGLTVLRPGDDWGGCTDPTDQRLNPSYFAPAYYLEFAVYVPSQSDFWLLLARDTYRLLDRYQQQMGGLLPDWAYADGRTLGSYGYEACRVPWRIGMDFAWHGSEDARNVLRRMNDYAAARGGPEAATDQKNSCFVGGLALTSIAISQDLSDSWYQLWINNIPESSDPRVGDSPYYQGTLRVLYLMAASSRFQPESGDSIYHD